MNGRFLGVNFIDERKDSGYSINKSFMTFEFKKVKIFNEVEARWRLVETAWKLMLQLN